VGAGRIAGEQRRDMAATRTAELRIATRASRLALIQAGIVAAALKHASGVSHSIVEISTKGDAARDRSIAAIGGDGVFVKELEAALLEDRADIAVHSLKDLPTLRTPGVDAGVTLERADARDVLVSRENRFAGVADLPAGAVVGTSSLRRRAQLANVRPDLDIRDIRGNVDTRVRKVLDGEYDAALLAYAGLERIGLFELVGGGSPLSLDLFVPAAGQGALFVQRRANDERCAEMIAPLDHVPTATATSLERIFLRAVGGGCLAPVGVHAAAHMDGALMTIHAFIGSPEGDVVIRLSCTVAARDAATRAATMADEMLAAGGREIIARHRDAGA
jgi:hydroxymethylbilane synthase